MVQLQELLWPEIQIQTLCRFIYLLILKKFKAFSRIIILLAEERVVLSNKNVFLNKIKALIKCVKGSSVGPNKHTFLA